MKLNKKGYLTVEIILASVVAFAIAFFLMELTVKLVSKSDDTFHNVLVSTDNALIIKNIKERVEDDINLTGGLSSLSCENTKCTLTYTLSNDTKTGTLYYESNKLIYKDINGMIQYSKEIDNSINKVTLTSSFNKDDKIALIYIEEEDIFTGTKYNMTIPINTVKGTLAEYITSLYNSAKKETVTANSRYRLAKISNTTYNNTYNCGKNECEKTYIKWDIEDSLDYEKTKNTSLDACGIKNSTDTTDDNYSSLFKIAKETTTTVKYNVASSVLLMNDRLGGTTTDYDGGNIRYYGASPNNYIYFNCSDYNNQSSSTCEVWRIIGVFNGKVKIIRNESIGFYSYDNKDTTTGAETNNGLNDWSKATLMKILNSGYDSETGGSLYWNGKSGTCYSGSLGNDNKPLPNSTKTCNFTSTGLKNDETRALISTEEYSLLGWDSNYEYATDMYNYERTNGNVFPSLVGYCSGRPFLTGDDDTLISQTIKARATSWEGKIALAYPSDYGYAGDLNVCGTKTLRRYYDDSKKDNINTNCRDNNWLNKIYTDEWSWLLSPYTSYHNGAWRINKEGYLSNATELPVINEFGIVPVLYLESYIGKKAGTGTIDNPYQLNVGSSSSLDIPEPEPDNTATIYLHMVGKYCKEGYDDSITFKRGEGYEVDLYSIWDETFGSKDSETELVCYTDEEKKNKYIFDNYPYVDTIRYQQYRLQISDGIPDKLYCNFYEKY